jgi:hypothetical protein
MNAIQLPDPIDLCKRLVWELEYGTRKDLRLLVFALAMNCQGTPAEEVLGTMYEWLVSEREWPELSRIYNVTAEATTGDQDGATT